MADTKIYPDSLVLLWENKVITGGQNENLQIPDGMVSVICDLRNGNVIESTSQFVELFRSNLSGWFDGMCVHMVDRDVVSFIEYQLYIPTYPAAAGMPTWNTCSGFIKGSGSAPSVPTIYRIYAGKQVDETGA